jgi:hypothetical protein
LIFQVYSILLTMEASFLTILEDISKTYNISHNDLVKKYSNQIKNISDEFEDPEIHTRCKGKNKNNKRCSKTKKEGSEYCSIHYSQYKDKDTDFMSSSDVEKKKSEGCILSNVIETTKKKGILPEKIKKISIDSIKYYVNKNEWIYEMDQETETILYDIPIGKLFSGKLMRLNIDETD